LENLFIPLKSKFPMKIKALEDRSSKIFLGVIEKGSVYTVNRFFDAISSDCIENAGAYISKNYQDAVDVLEIKDSLENGCKPFFIKTKISSVPKNCRLETVFISDIDDKNKLIHIYMLNEPDIFSTWKIYNIEEEII